MANWSLCCKNCGKHFEYSKIPDTLQNFYLPQKPDFPEGRLEAPCPRCKEKAMYARSDLIFHADERL